MSNDVEVVIRDFDYASTARNIEEALVALGEASEPSGCGVDVSGESHPPSIPCPNEDYDRFAEKTYCMVKRARELAQRKGENEWLPSMLEFYWQNGISAKSAEFLKSTGFLISYK